MKNKIAYGIITVTIIFLLYTLIFNEVTNNQIIVCLLLIISMLLIIFSKRKI